MKQVVAIFVLLVVLVVAVVLNAVYINKVATEMTALLDALPEAGDPACVSAAVSLREEWMRRAPIVDLSVSYLFTDRICEQSALLIACAEAGDAYGFASARALLADAFHDMCHAETFSPVSLF